MKKPDLLTAIKPMCLVKATSRASLSEVTQLDCDTSGRLSISSKNGTLARVRTPNTPSVWQTGRNNARKTQTTSLNQEHQYTEAWDWNDELHVNAIIECLKNLAPARFNDLLPESLKDKTLNAEAISRNFFVKELDAICEAIPVAMLPEKPKKKWNKVLKSNLLSRVLGDGSQQMPTRSPGSLSTLKALAYKILKLKWPKLALAVVWAELKWPERLEDWKAKATVQSGIPVGKLESIEWYSYVERYENKLLPACIDPSHLLTNMRAKVTKDGIVGVPKSAFVKVANKCPEIVNRAVIVDQLDKQSVAFACRVFSKEVSEKMIEFGDHGAASFVTVMREWYEAVDSPGLSAESRVDRLLNMKEYLLERHKPMDFSRFPAVGSHVKGIPFIWFDSMLQGIDTRLQMYAILGTYSHRAIGTLPVESFFGDLSDMEQTKLGCPKAIHVPRLMACTTEINTYRHNSSDRYD